MRLIENKSFPYYTFGQFAGLKDLTHFITAGKKNIGYSDEVPVGVITRNRQELAKAVGFEIGNLVTAHQVHSTNVAVVTGKDAGRGALDRESRLPETDALVTDCTNLCLMVLSADCIPVLLFEPQKQVIAAIHAGWRGTAGEIVAKTVQVMQERFGCAPDRIYAGIGPSIGPCCFEVGCEVADIFRESFPDQPEMVTQGKKADRWMVDLWQANRTALLKSGLHADRIEVAGWCSVCGPQNFFSYRREGKMAGRFGAGIMMRSRNK